MTVLDSLPLLVVVLLLVAGSGADPDAMHVAFDGEQTATDLAGATATADARTPTATGPLVVAGGTVTVPANETVDGDLYVVDGTARVHGAVDGDVTVLAGNLSVADGARVSGELATYGGNAAVAQGASVARRTTVEVVAQERSLAERAGFFALQSLVLAALAALAARRHPKLLANVEAAMTEHAVVSGVAGALAGTTLLVCFVAMAFTVVLLPVTVLGLVAEFLVVLYALVAYAHLVGRHLPVSRPDLAAALGAPLVLLALELLSLVPVLGGLVQLAVVCVGLGAVLVTYLGLQRFEPATLPG